MSGHPVTVRNTAESALSTPGSGPGRRGPTVDNRPLRYAAGLQICGWPLNFASHSPGTAGDFGGRSAGGQVLVPHGAVMVCRLAGDVGLGGSTDGVQARRRWPEPGQPYVLSRRVGSLGGLGGIGVADPLQRAVRHGADVGPWSATCGPRLPSGRTGDTADRPGPNRQARTHQRVADDSWLPCLNEAAGLTRSGRTAEERAG